MDEPSLDILRIADRDILDFIEQVSKQGGKIVDSRWVLRRLERVAKRLEQAGKVLGADGRVTGRRASALDVMRYAETLKGLRVLLEGIQYSLLVERSHLENIRANLESAGSWAASLRELS